VDAAGLALEILPGSIPGKHRNVAEVASLVSRIASIEGQSHRQRRREIRRQACRASWRRSEPTCSRGCA